MPHCPACPARLPRDATRCSDCGATFTGPRYGVLESRLSPTQEAAIKIAKPVPITLGLLGIGGAAWGLMAVAAGYSQLQGGIVGNAIAIGMATLYLFSGYCGVRALQKATGWLRLNQMLWALQIPIIITPILSFAFASGAFVNAWIRLQPSIGYGATALLGSNFTFNLFTPGNTAFGVNLVAVAITYYLTRVQRSE